MPTPALSDPELQALSSWPDDNAGSDLIAYFYLRSESDMRWLRSHRNPLTSLALALRMTGPPYPGFVP